METTQSPTRTTITTGYELIEIATGRCVQRVLAEDKPHLEANLADDFDTANRYRLDPIRLDVLIYETTAPAAYDYGYTTQAASDGNLRTVLIEATMAQYQIDRYSSGMYLVRPA